MKRSFKLILSLFLVVSVCFTGCSRSTPPSELAKFKQLAEECLYLDKCGYAVEGFREKKEYFADDYYYALQTQLAGKPMYNDADIDEFINEQPASKTEILDKWNQNIYQPENGPIKMGVISSVETFTSTDANSIIYRIQYFRQFNPESKGDIRCAICTLSYDDDYKVTQLEYGYYSLFPEVLQDELF